jgi:hypothetical protein
MYRRIQFIRLIYYFLFLLDDDTHSLQLVIGDVYEVGGYFFLSTVIPDPNNSGWNIDVCLHPLIDELK